MLTAALHRIVDGLSPGRVLDLACGRGEIAVYLAARGWQVIAVDRDPQKLVEIEPRTNIDVRLMDLEHDRIALLGTFDLIVAWRYYQPSLLPQVREQLKPGGVAALCVKTSGRFAALPADLRAAFEPWRVLFEAPADGFAALIVQAPE